MINDDDDKWFSEKNIVGTYVRINGLACKIIYSKYGLSCFVPTQLLCMKYTKENTFKVLKGVTNIH